MNTVAAFFSERRLQEIGKSTDVTQALGLPGTETHRRDQEKEHQRVRNGSVRLETAERIRRHSKTLAAQADKRPMYIQDATLFPSRFARHPPDEAFSNRGSGPTSVSLKPSDSASDLQVDIGFCHAGSFGKPLGSQASRSFFGEKIDKLESWIPSRAYDGRQGRELLWLRDLRTNSNLHVQRSNLTIQR